MSSPVTSADFEAAIPANNANVCEKLTALFNLPNLLAQLTEFLLDSNGNPSEAFLSLVAQTLTPTGAYTYAATADLGDQWLLCDGRAVSRTTYAALFAKIGTTFGIGDGSTTFNLPSGSQKSLIGVGGTWAQGDVVGSLTHTLTVNEIPAHSHGWSGPNTRTEERGDGANVVWAQTAAAETDETGGGAAHSSLHPCIVAWLHIHV